MAQPSLTPGLDTLAESSHYALEQLRLARELDMNNNNNNSNDSSSQFIKTDNKSGRLDSPDPAGSRRQIMRSPLSDARSGIRKHSADTAAVRRRISRACDQCNQLRTKCDGQSPCAHCTGEIPIQSFISLKLINWFWGWHRVRPELRIC